MIIPSQFYEKQKDQAKGVPFHEREKKVFSFEDLCNLAASIQFGILGQGKPKMKIALEWCQYKDIPLTALVSKDTVFIMMQNLAGGVSCNQAMKEMYGKIAQEYQLPLTTSPRALCTDNAAMIAWTGWELLNAQ